MNRVYVDNAATTAVCSEAVAAMIPYLSEIYGNPSSLHSFGQEASAAIGTARIDIASCIGAQHKEIYFTSGGSESDNWAIFAAANLGAKKDKKHIISSKFEHHAVLHTLARLEKDGFEVTYLDVYSDGIIRIDDLKNTIREDTALVTIMYANNEIGTIQPIAEIGKVCREKGVLFHTDAVQAVGHVPINVADEHIDLLSLSAHKFHGPKGVGILYINENVKIKPLVHGGAQERNMRAGTENLYGIVGFAKAL